MRALGTHRPCVLESARTARPAQCIQQRQRERAAIVVHERALEMVQQIGRSMGLREVYPDVRDTARNEIPSQLTSSRSAREVLGWSPKTALSDGLRETIAWYQRNGAWVGQVRSGEYLRYYSKQYGQSLNRDAEAALVG